jgi:hypothetical protein
LLSTITSSATSLSVTDASRFPTAGNFRLLVESELMLVTGVSSNTFTVTRGIEGTVAAAHAAGREVSHIITAGALNRFKFDGWFSPIQLLTAPGSSLPTGSSGSFSVSTEFQPLDYVKCSGVRFYWGSANKTVKVSLWDEGGSRLDFVNVSVTSTGVYEGYFSSATQLNYFNTYRVSAWQTDGVNYTGKSGVPSYPTLPFIGGPYLLWSSFKRYSAGDAFPTLTAGSEHYPVEPILEML